MVSRRKALSIINGSLGCLVGASVVVPVGGALLDPIIRKDEKGTSIFVDVGALEDFPEGAVRAVVANEARKDSWVQYPPEPSAGLFVRRIKGEELQVFSRVCPHLGCSINKTKSGGFNCPCHGSAFDDSGARLDVGGKMNPSPRDMDALDVEVREGRVWVRIVHFRTGVAEKEAIS